MSSAIASSGVSGSLPRCLRQRSKRNSRDWSRVGLNIASLGQPLRLGGFRLLPPASRLLFRDLLPLRELALLEDGALGAEGLFRHARVAAVQDQVMVGVAQVFLRRDLEEPGLHLAGILARSEPRAVAHAEAVRT